MKYKLCFEWWNHDTSIEKIPEEHKEELILAAMERTHDMRKEGFVSGELLTSIDDIDYRGWWEIKNEE